MPAQCWPTAFNGAVPLVQPRPSIVSHVHQEEDPAGTIRWTYADPMLGQRRRQWANIGLA